LCLTHTITIGILPHTQIGIAFIAGINNTVGITVQLTQFFVTGALRATEQFANVINSAIRVAIPSQETVVAIEPCSTRSKAITVQVEVGIAALKAGQFYTVSIEIENQRVARYLTARATTTCASTATGTTAGTTGATTTRTIA